MLRVLKEPSARSDPAPGLRWMSTDRPACGSCAASGPPHPEWPLFLPQFVPIPEHPVHLDSALLPPLPNSLCGLWHRQWDPRTGLLGLLRGWGWAQERASVGQTRCEGRRAHPVPSCLPSSQREAAGGQAGLAGPPCSSISQRTTLLPLPPPRPPFPSSCPRVGQNSWTKAVNVPSSRPPSKASTLPWAPLA